MGGAIGADMEMPMAISARVGATKSTAGAADTTNAMTATLVSETIEKRHAVLKCFSRLEPQTFVPCSPLAPEPCSAFRERQLTEFMLSSRT
jgi:hypothetical protein